MKRNKTLLLLALLFICALAAYFLLQNRNQRSTLDIKEDAFAVADTAAVTKIFLSSKAGNNILLERQSGNKWLLNKKYPAYPSMVNILLETLHRMEVKRPVARQARNNVIKEIASMGTKVEVYTKDGLLKTFYVGNPTTSHTGTNFIMEGAEMPYILSIPGFEGYLTSRFTAPEKEWRSRLVFSSMPASIRELTVAYPDTPAYDFRIRQEAGKPMVEGLEGVNETTVREYLGMFHNVHAEQLITDMPQRFRDSLSLVKPWVVMQLKDADPKRNAEITIYPNGGNKDRTVAVYGPDRTMVTVQALVFNPLLVTKRTFLMQPSKSPAK